MTTLDAQRLKKDFPILAKKRAGKTLHYLDNTATTQKPVHVIDAVRCYYEYSNANIHRGAYELSQESSSLYEEAHKETARFANARHWEEIAFTRNTTESLNVVARGLLDSELKKGDTVLTTLMEHHSNFVPWQQMRKKGIRVEIANVTPEGKLDEADLEAKLEKQPKVFAFTAASNVLGTINDVKGLAKKGKKAGAITVVDAAQSAPHQEMEARDKNIDFMAFSAHKMLGPTGIGALYGKKERLEALPPLLTGGDMIHTVSVHESTWNALPWKFEAGTPNIAGGIGFRVALKYLADIGMQKIQKHEHALLVEATRRMEALGGVTIYGPSVKEKLGIISFNVDGVHPHDVATILDRRGVAIRSGDHCAQPLMAHLNMAGTARASFYLYNDMADVEALLEGIRAVQKTFGTQKTKAPAKKVSTHA